MAFDTPIYTNRQSIDRVLSTGLPLVIVFFRRHSPLTRQLDPVLQTLAGEYAGRVLFAKIDVEDELDLAKRFAVNQVPAVVFARNGKVEATAIGAIGMDDLRRWSEYLARGGVRPAIPSGPAEPLPEPPPPPVQEPPKGTGGKPVTLTDANFDTVIQGDLPVLVDFWAPWCGPCRMIAPTVEALAKEFDGKLVVGKLNVDENPRTASRYGIMSIPTLMIFRRGKAVDSIVGAVPASMLRQRILPHLN